MIAVRRVAIGWVVLLLGGLCGAGCSQVPHDRSYDYGVAVMAHIEGEPGTPGRPRQRCERELDASPSPFPGYKRSHAIRGCLDYDLQVN